MAEKKDLKQNETLEQNTKTEPAYNKKTAVSIKQTIKI